TTTLSPLSLHDALPISRRPSKTESWPWTSRRLHESDQQPTSASHPSSPHATGGRRSHGLLRPRDLGAPPSRWPGDRAHNARSSAAGPVRSGELGDGAGRSALVKLFLLGHRRGS